MSTILDSKWWTPPLPGLSVLAQTIIGDTGLCIGAVAVESHDGWKCYIGYGRSKSASEDAQSIAENGMPIGSNFAACGLFPGLDPERFRY